MFAAEQDERELRDALRLHQRQHFKQFVERAEAAGHETKPRLYFTKQTLRAKK